MRVNTLPLSRFIETNKASKAMSAAFLVLVLVFLPNALANPLQLSAASPALTWNAATISADGTFIGAADGAVGGSLYTSTDAGQSWVAILASPSIGSNQWAALVSSADFTFLAAAASGDKIYTSYDGGVIWGAYGSSVQQWSCMTVSQDGRALAAATINGRVFTSRNGGRKWKESTASGATNYMSMASSADNAKIFAVDGTGAGSGGYIYLSTDFGITWVSNSAISLFAGGSYVAQPGAQTWKAVACSTDGRVVVAAATGGSVWTSRNGGGLFYERKNVQNGAAIWASGKLWTALALAPDASVIFAAETTTPNGQGLWESTDFGITWDQSQAVLPAGTSFQVLVFGGRLSTSSANGNQLVALDGAAGGQIYTLLMCPSGTFSALSDKACTNCPAGSTSSGGLSSCDVPCSVGTFANSGDAAYPDADGNLQCAACPQGQFQGAAGASSCVSCPADMTTKVAMIPPGASSASACLDTKRSIANAKLTAKGLGDAASGAVIGGVLGGLLVLSWGIPAMQIYLGWGS